MKWISSSTSLLKKVCLLARVPSGHQGPCRSAEKGDVGDSAGARGSQRLSSLQGIAQFLEASILSTDV